MAFTVVSLIRSFSASDVFKCLLSAMVVATAVAGIPIVSVAVIPFDLSTSFVSINVEIIFDDRAGVVLVAFVVDGTGTIISSVGRWLVLWLLISLSIAGVFVDVSVGVMISESPFSLDSVSSFMIAVASVIVADAVAVWVAVVDVDVDDVVVAFASVLCDLIGNDAQLVEPTPLPLSAGMAK